MICWQIKTGQLFINKIKIICFFEVEQHETGSVSNEDDN
jgi:hypothetical protein